MVKPVPRVAVSAPVIAPVAPPHPAPLVKPAPRATPIALEARTRAVADDAPQPAYGAGRLVVQVGAFADRARASSVAQHAGGRVQPASNLFRVRMGPFASQAEANAALAKARAAGYSDARIQRAD
ncbi:hypothetical protein GTZ99_06680 [Novosphingobium sp. FSY-8]|uniref:SPOR domain-containing protein n=1 Tax=Novosphingobium ovatum TaxID=1908523 RepID=A0ABW9XCK1_9SPHN|nr:hypothetical protein [Novosphingobium ovatum]